METIIQALIEIVKPLIDFLSDPNAPDYIPTALSNAVAYYGAFELTKKILINVFHAVKDTARKTKDFINKVIEKIKDKFNR